MHPCIGKGNGSPLQCSCLENPGDGGAWWAAVSGVTTEVGHDWSDLAAAAVAAVTFIIKVQIQVGNLASRALLDPVRWSSQPHLSVLILPSRGSALQFSESPLHLASCKLHTICLCSSFSFLPSPLLLNNSYLSLRSHMEIPPAILSWPPQTPKSWGAPPLCSHSILNFPAMICIRLPWHCPIPSLPSHLDQKPVEGICLAALIVESQDN